MLNPNFTLLSSSYVNLMLFYMNKRPVLIGNLFQLHEDSHDRRGRAASHYHYLIIYDI